VALLRLQDEGGFWIKGATLNQIAETPVIRDVLALLDTSDSMTGIEIFEVRSGAVDFSQGATERGYVTDSAQL
jgi:hypothetical protein